MSWRKWRTWIPFEASSAGKTRRRRGRRRSLGGRFGESMWVRVVGLWGKAVAKGFGVKFLAVPSLLTVFQISMLDICLILGQLLREVEKE